jgi:hypothetical protein
MDWGNTVTVGSVICGLIAVVVGWLIKARVRRRQERKYIEKFPIMKDLKEGQVITVVLKNGDRLAEVVFIDHFHSMLMLGTDREFDEETGEMLVGDVRWVKLNKVTSKEVDSRRLRVW